MDLQRHVVLIVTCQDAQDHIVWISEEEKWGNDMFQLDTHMPWMVLLGMVILCKWKRSKCLCIFFNSSNSRIKKFSWFIDANGQAVLFLGRHQQLLQSQTHRLHPEEERKRNQPSVYYKKSTQWCLLQFFLRFNYYLMLLINCCYQCRWSQIKSTCAQFVHLHVWRIVINQVFRLWPSDV